jgi:FixJ family two-component response regulator
MSLGRPEGVMPSVEKNKTVVIVEDDASVSQAMARMLRAAGLDPVTFASAEAMLASRATAPAPLCLVIDVQLPGMNGFALRDRLAGAGVLPPVVFITAFDEPETRAAAGRAGAAAFLAKPFTGRVLLDTIRRATLPA